MPVTNSRRKPGVKTTITELLNAEERRKHPAPTVADLLPTIRKMLSKSAVSPSSIASSLGVDISLVTKVLGELDVRFEGHLVTLSTPDAGKIDFRIFGDKWQTIGLIGDTHLCSTKSREKEIASTYDVFASEGITDVYHAGNIVDGYIPRLNGGEVICTSIDDQTQYVIDHYPKRSGITTRFITGDDHEGWWQKEGFNFGKHLELMAIDQHRTDLVYIGHVESDVALIGKGGTAILRIQHPGGGSSYARSYTQQKTIEAMEGGEKPDILVQGHYHVSNFMQDRNVFVISLPGFQDQTMFARKKRLRMEIGGAILKFKQSPFDGTITRCSVEFIRYFDRGYYQRFLKSDAKALPQPTGKLRRD